jgi:hypothetical protein
LLDNAITIITGNRNISLRRRTIRHMPIAASPSSTKIQAKARLRDLLLQLRPACISRAEGAFLTFAGVSSAWLQPVPPDIHVQR